jgi:hypothetical protein
MRLYDLIPDAFRILSASYVRIGELGTELVQRQQGYSYKTQKSVNRLIDCTMLFSTIMRHIVLNTAGTAIVQVRYQEVSVINDLILELKKCVGLYTLPIFPTPMTTYNFNFGSSQETESEVGADTVVTSGVSAQLDFDSKKIMVFTADTPITGILTIGYLNDENALRYDFIFNIPNESVARLVFFNAEMSDPRWEQNNPNEWVPGEPGNYRATAILSDSVWKIDISQSTYV